MGEAKPANISLMSDNDLRPWTLNAEHDNLLAQESERLNSVVSQTSPQKIAGVRGSSSLEKLDSLSGWQDDFKSTWQPKPTWIEKFEMDFRSPVPVKAVNEMIENNEISPMISRKMTPLKNNASISSDLYSSPNISNSESFSDSYMNNNSNTSSSSIIQSSQFEKIEKLRRKILQREEKRLKSLCTSRTSKNDMAKVDYKQMKSPKVMNMSTQNYVSMCDRYSK